MISQTRLKALGAMFADVCKAYHYRRPKMEPPYLIWAEDGAENWGADLTVKEQRFTGAADYYTKDEYDATIDAIQAEATASGIWLALDSVQYEEETNLIHYSWRWVL